MLTIYHDTSKLSTMVMPVFLATRLLTTAPVMSSGEEGIVHMVVQAVSETAKTVSTKTGEAWVETKQSAGGFAEVVGANKPLCPKPGFQGTHLVADCAVGYPELLSGTTHVEVPARTLEGPERR